jgi:hypothetical protein
MQRREAVDLRVAFGRFAQTFAVACRDRLHADDSTLESGVRPQFLARRYPWNHPLG